MIATWLAVQVALAGALVAERRLPVRPAGERQRRARLLVGVAVGAPVALAAWGAVGGPELAPLVDPQVWSGVGDGAAGAAGIGGPTGTAGGSSAAAGAGGWWEALGTALGAAEVALGAALGAAEAALGVAGERISATVDGCWAAAVTEPLVSAVASLLPASLPTSALGAVLVALPGLAWLAVDLGRLARLLAGGVTVRRVGAVAVVVSGRAKVPFAARTFTRALVVLDPATFADPHLRDVAIRHELGHHRRGDPAWALGMAVLRALSWPSPAAHAWARRLAEIDELACDAAVAPRVGAVLYAEALLAVAARVVAARGSTARALPVPGLTPAPGRPGDRRSLLTRRIRMLLTPPRPSSPTRARAALVVALVATVVPAALLPGAIAADLPAADLPAADLPAAAEPASAGDLPVPFPLDRAAPVEAALTAIRENPARRAWVTRAIAARDAWRPLVDGALAEAGLPAELAAVPLVESGYTNWGAPGVGSGGSLAPGIPGRGLWMFIPATARAYGLRVDATVDERFDPVRETEAAIAVLADLHDTYGDWRLALAGYNQGNTAVDRAIAVQGTRDPWALVEAGALNDYVPQVVAAAILLADPAQLDP